MDESNDPGPVTSTIEQIVAANNVVALYVDEASIKNQFQGPNPRYFSSRPVQVWALTSTDVSDEEELQEIIPIILNDDGLLVFAHETEQAFLGTYPVSEVEANVAKFNGLAVQLQTDLEAIGANVIAEAENLSVLKN